MGKKMEKYIPQTQRRRMKDCHEFSGNLSSSDNNPHLSQTELHIRILQLASPFFHSAILCLSVLLMAQDHDQIYASLVLTPFSTYKLFQVKSPKFQHDVETYTLLQSNPENMNLPRSSFLLILRSLLFFHISAHQKSSTIVNNRILNQSIRSNKHLLPDNLPKLQT